MPDGVFTPLTLVTPDARIAEVVSRARTRKCRGLLRPRSGPILGRRFRIGVDMTGSSWLRAVAFPRGLRSGVTVVNLPRSLPPGPRHLTARAAS